MGLMNEYQKELLGLMRQVDDVREAYTGIHKRVAKMGIYTEVYLSMFKRGERLPKDKEKINQLIEAYETELWLANRKAKSNR